MKEVWTVEMVEKICAMQDELNCMIHPNWIKQGWCWQLAIADEVMELANHVGWKWWKDAGTPKFQITPENLKQVQLEAIDILHFLVSWHLDVSEGLSGRTHVIALQRGLDYGAQRKSKHDLLSLLRCVLTIEPWALGQLLDMLELTPEKVLEVYTQKYVLNKFRQDHGYKDGTYCKHWKVELPDAEAETLEDNEVLELVVDMFKSEGETIEPERLYNGLKARYNARLNK